MRTIVNVGSSEKLNRKLRASETERVRLSRELDATRRDRINGIALWKQAKMEIKRLKKEVESLREKTPHVGARVG